MKLCSNDSYLYDTAIDQFRIDTEWVDADLYKGGIFLGCSFGTSSLIIWAFGILASGQTAMIIGTHASKYTTEGFLNVYWAHWKRSLATRIIVITPVFFVAFYCDITVLTSMNVILNVVKSFQLPFAIIPAIAFTSSVSIMGKFVNGIITNIVSILLFVVIFCVNSVYLVFQLNGLDSGWLALVGK